MGTVQQLIEEMIAQIQTTLQAGSFVDTEQLRRLADRVDGIRYAHAVLADEGLSEPRNDDELRQALKVLRLSSQALSVSGREGFGEGVNDVRTLVARAIERSLPSLGS